mmetsp:Transcript_26617/g.37488  ORF Transcript_26617/g.37488 Transcript_26617/m.37488 type:complete len:301 (-) Transcript_26617:124-1026(-)
MIDAASVNNDYTLVYQAGLSVMALQCVLHFIFANLAGNGPWKHSPSFTAHQMICLPLMICYTSIGFYGWFWVAREETEESSFLFATPTERVTGEIELGLQLSKIVLGTQLFWDLPYEFIFKSTKEREIAMVLHHIGMAIVAGIHVGVFSSGIPVAPYYALFFFGVIEISSIFLALVDVFHPKQKAWYEYLQTQGPNSALNVLNEICRVVFAVSYLIVRTIYFPYIGFGYLVPDFAYIASLESEEERNYYLKALLYCVIVILTLFAILQLYWGLFIAKQVAKAIGLTKSGGDSPATKEKAN